MIAGKYIMDIVYSEVRGKTGRKILKIYFSLSVSRVSRALSLLLYTSPPSSAPGIASSCTTNTISCISHLFSQPLFFLFLVFHISSFFFLQQREGRRNSNCTAQHSTCVCVWVETGGGEGGRGNSSPFSTIQHLGGNRGGEGGNGHLSSSSPLSLHTQRKGAIVKWN